MRFRRVTANSLTHGSPHIGAQVGETDIVEHGLKDVGPTLRGFRGYRTRQHRGCGKAGSPLCIRPLQR